ATIDLDQLAVTGQIGLTATGSATIVNATPIEFKTTTVGGDLSAQALAGGISDAPAIVLSVGGLTQLMVPAAEDIRLGDEGATFQTARLAIESARHASIRAATGFIITHAALDRTHGVLYLKADVGHVVQDLASTAPLQAWAAAVTTPLGATFLHTAQFDWFAARAGMALDVASLAALDDEYSWLTTERLDAYDDRALPPAVRMLAMQALSPKWVVYAAQPTNPERSGADPDGGPGVVAEMQPAAAPLNQHFGVVLAENRGTLTVGPVQDPTAPLAERAATQINGINSPQGHVYLAAIAENGDPGDIEFSAAAPGGIAAVEGVVLEVGSLLHVNRFATAVAAGEVRIVSGAVLQSYARYATGPGATHLAPGRITSIDNFTTYDDRAFGDVGKTGAWVRLEPPDMQLDALTSRFVGRGNNNTQQVTLDIGMGGEQGFLVEILWADGERTVALVNQSVQATFTHQFTNEFLYNPTRYANFPELPTTIRVFNSPLIGLFADGGAVSLNRTIAASGSPISQPDVVVVARVQSPPLGETREQPARPGPLFPPSEIRPPYLTQVPTNLPPQYDPARAAVVPEQVVVYYGSLPTEESDQIDPASRELWEEGRRGDYIEEIKARILDDDEKPPGLYGIEVVDAEGKLLEELYKFRKEPESDALDPPSQRRGASLDSDRAAAPPVGVIEGDAHSAHAGAASNRAAMHNLSANVVGQLVASSMILQDSPVASSDRFAPRDSPEIPLAIPRPAVTDAMVGGVLAARRAGLATAELRFGGDRSSGRGL
ncbi:MAG TPA: hypothetical protein PKC18_12345, partial [Lacipirellulaceae bacterium]|nr:hypothetical protein [Lacipirellulaceae bacterium]